MAKWSFFPSNSIPAARGPHYKICHARGTNRAVTISPIAGRWGGGWEDSPAFAPLREPCLSIGLLVEQQSRGSGAYLGAPSLRVGAICSVLSTEIWTASLCYKIQDKWHWSVTFLQTWTKKKQKYSENWWFISLTTWTWMFIWGNGVIWYIIHVTPKCSHLMKVSHILQLSQNRTAEDLTAKSSLTNLWKHLKKTTLRPVCQSRTRTLLVWE